MRKHWQEINYKPGFTDMNEVDIITDEELEQVSAKISNKPQPVYEEPTADILEKCTGVVIPGIKKDSDMSDFLGCLIECGLPNNFSVEDLHFKEKRRSKTATIYDLNPKISTNIVKNLQGKIFAGRMLTAYTLVEDTPIKKTPQKSNSGNDSSSEKSDDDSSDSDDYNTSYENHDPSSGFIFKNVDTFKRKAKLSPVLEPQTQSKKERKRQKKLNK